MTLSDIITRFDLWLLDRVFQPVADRLPERIPAYEAGMSLLLGSLLLLATSIAAMIILLGEDPVNAIYDILIWGMWVAFYLGVNRMRILVRPGFMNPLRTMFLGFRPISFAFLLYAIWQSTSMPPPFSLGLWFNALADLAFVCGVYMISCEQTPPKKKQVNWKREFGGVPDQG